MTTSSIQKYWFPGEANKRSIFDFTGDVLNIETPGFPLVPKDSNNFGSVITLENDIGYYIIGKYLVDANFSEISGADGIFDDMPENISCNVFAPDLNNINSAHLYYIDNNGLNYGHISHNIANESSLDSSYPITLTYPPVKKSPLSIIGDSNENGNWLFYVSTENEQQILVTVYCNAGTEISYQKFVLPTQDSIINIEICKNKISLVSNKTDLLYGTLTPTDHIMNVTFDGTINNISDNCIQCAFSSSAASIFWLTKEIEKCSVSYMNLSTGTITTSQTNNNYIALKCGPDNIIYGLSHRTLGSATLLTITPDNYLEEFSITEIYTSASGGYFPTTAWSEYSL